METKQKNRRTSATTGRTKRVRRRTKEKKTESQVIYTQPAPFNRNRFVLRLATVIAVVLALFFGMSIFFKVDKVMVAGAQKYTEWQIMQAAGVREGDELLGVSSARVSGRIKTALPYIKQVRVGIKLPDTVHIEVVELDVVYAIQADDESYWLVDAQGRVIEQIANGKTKDYTRISGVKLSAPQAGEQAVAMEPEAQEATGTLDDGQPVSITVPVTVSHAQRLETALEIARNLEICGVLGEVVTIDVTDMANLELWYGERYQVLLGDELRLDYKISAMKSAIDQSSKYQSGILDVSFTIWKDMVGYTPF